MPTARSVLIAHPSADLYGSDLQLLETISAVVEAGWSAHVVLPARGPLVPLLQERGASVSCRSFPVLRKSMINLPGLFGLVLGVIRSLPGMLAEMRRVGADVVLVNTVTIPWWLLAGRLTRRLTVGHVHEAEDEGHRIVLTALALPNLLAHRLVVNSQASAATLTGSVSRLSHRITVVHNGVPGPAEPPLPLHVRSVADPATLVVVARLSPRKGVDVALEAVAALRTQGRDVRLVVCGSVFPGYEWFEDALRVRAAQPDLRGAVEFRGYVSPTWPVLAEADVVVVPSRVEPFGNTAVEALLAERPLVASNTQGLAEIVVDGSNAMLSAPGDAKALAAQVALILDDPALANRLASAGRDDALSRFSPERYRSSMRGLLNDAP
ncbi:glycosyltransferase family 4 protein [Aeromicrobium sp.]|uniref:glycosyltransferase family 4 protein n=1 Tax=Aeromicrobium sp. TaxID=1871063 RepID=UPI0025BB398A|nr:glycosyltransferase family 4 protein [Aeromicrobium sp.]